VEGIALALARIQPVEVDRVDLRLWPGLRLVPSRWVMAAFGDRPERGMRSFYGIDWRKLPRVDLIVASGVTTLPAANWLTRLTGTRAIYSGYPTDGDMSEMALVLVNAPEQLSAPNTRLVPIPSTIDPDSLRAPRVLRSLEALRGAEVSLLLGGRASGYSFAAGDWRHLAEVVAESADKFGLRWSVSNSRRTPAAASRLFAGLAASGAIARFIDYRVAGPGSANALFAADAVVVTRDSVTMISEGLTARRPVIALVPAVTRPRIGESVVAALGAKGGLAGVSIPALTAATLVETLVGLEPSRSDPTAVIAATIAEAIDLAPPSKT
jgi:mitochondrial fission protein ELM1